MQPTVSYITLATNDIPKAVAFYRDVFGMAAGKETDTYAFLKSPGAILALYHRKHWRSLTGTPAPAMVGGVLVSLNVGSETEVNAIIERATAQGSLIQSDATATEWGGYNGMIQTPEGHLWEIVFNPNL